ncbi:MAG: hypothetical protein AMXMBFR34_40580 [Myxococcaceae bacterium]
MVAPIRLPPGTLPPLPGGSVPSVPYKEPKAVITLPPKLGRPPKATDLLIQKGFDGLSPDRAVTRIRNKLTNTLAPENRKLVEDTARRAHRDFTVALNNVFTPGSPNNKFVEQFAGRQVSVLGTMSALNPVVYKVEGKGLEPTRFYARDWSGRFAELGRPPNQVVMEAKVRLSPPGLAMDYPKWTNKALSSRQLTTIEEL